MTIKSINWTYTTPVDNFASMERNEQSQEIETRTATTHECECPEPCNCDHENE
jgi:hypothetical protein